MTIGWSVLLNDGRVFMDTDSSLQGFNTSPWIALKHYIEENELVIERLSIGYADDKTLNDKVISPLPDFPEAFFFSNKVAKVMQFPEELHFYLIGVKRGGIILIQQWKTPELILCGTEMRKLSEVNPDCLIYNAKNI